MNRRRLWLFVFGLIAANILVIVLLVLPTCSRCQAALQQFAPELPRAAERAPVTPAGQPPRPERVIVISLDGARPDGILTAETPYIQGLAARGAVSWEALTVLPSVTLPAHASMLTGLGVSQHGVNYSDLLGVSQHGVNYSDLSHNMGVMAAPTFITLAQEAGYRSAMVVGKEKFRLYRQREDVSYSFMPGGDPGVAERVIELMHEHYQMIFAHFPNPDVFGHSTGWMSETYLAEFSNTDMQVGRILTELDVLGWTESTLVILTADHGGHDRTHGSDIPEDRLIPWMVAGPGVIPGTALSRTIYVHDTAATVLWTLGLPPVPDGVGLPTYEAFSCCVEEMAAIR